MKFWFFGVITLYTAMSVSGDRTLLCAKSLEELQTFIKNLLALQITGERLDTALKRIFCAEEVYNIYQILDNFLQAPETQKLLLLMKSYKGYKKKRKPRRKKGQAVIEPVTDSIDLNMDKYFHSEVLPLDILDIRQELLESLDVIEICELQKAIDNVLEHPIMQQLNKYLKNKFYE